MDSTTVDIPAEQPRRLPAHGQERDAPDLERRVRPRRAVVGPLAGPRERQPRLHRHERSRTPQWMFDISQIGDVVKYVNSSRPLEQGNGYTDWNVPWNDWLKAGSALLRLTLLDKRATPCYG